MSVRPKAPAARSVEENAGVDVQNLAGDAIGAAEGDQLIGHVVPSMRQDVRPT